MPWIYLYDWMILLKLYFVSSKWKLGSPVVPVCFKHLPRMTRCLLYLVIVWRDLFWSFHWGASLFWLLNYHAVVPIYIYWPVALVVRFGDSPGSHGIGQDQHQASGRRRSLSPDSNTDSNTDSFCADLSNKLTLNSLSVLSSRQAALEIKVRIGFKCRRRDVTGNKWCLQVCAAG